MILVEQAANRRIQQTKLSQEISKLLNGWQTPNNPADQKMFETRQADAIELTVDVLNMASTKQRNNAADRAAGWAEDFLILASRN